MAVGAGGQGINLLSELDAEQAASLITQHREQLERTVAAGNQVIDSFRDTLLKRVPNASQPTDTAADLDDPDSPAATFSPSPTVAPVATPARKTRAMRTETSAPSPVVEDVAVPTRIQPVAPAFADAPAFSADDPDGHAHTWHPTSFDTIPPSSGAGEQSDVEDPFASREAEQRLAFQAMLARLRDGQLSVDDAEHLMGSPSDPAIVDAVNRGRRFGASHS
jgi:hypothetical protein